MEQIAGNTIIARGRDLLGAINMFLDSSSASLPTLVVSLSGSAGLTTFLMIETFRILEYSVTLFVRKALTSG